MTKGVGVANIEDLFDEFRSRLVAGDADDVARLYAPDAVLTVVNTITGEDRWMKSRGEVRDQYASCFATASYLDVERPRGGTFQISNDGTTAQWTGPVRSVLLFNDGVNQHTVWSESTEFYGRAGGVWTIQYDHSVVEEHEADPKAALVRQAQYSQVFELFESSKPFHDQVQSGPEAALTKLLGPLPASVMHAIHDLGPTPHVDLETLRSLLPIGSKQAGW